MLNHIALMAREKEEAHDPAQDSLKTTSLCVVLLFMFLIIYSCLKTLDHEFIKIQRFDPLLRSMTGTSFDVVGTSPTHSASQLSEVVWNALAVLSAAGSIEILHWNRDGASSNDKALALVNRSSIYTLILNTISNFSIGI